MVTLPAGTSKGSWRGIYEAIVQTAAAGGGAVTIADGADVAQGAVADAAWVSGSGTLVSLTKTIANAALDTTPVQVNGDVTAGAADTSTLPVAIGGLAKTANPTAAADGQRVKGMFDKLGKLIAVGAIRELKGQEQHTITASTAETTIVTAVAATFLDLYGLIIANTSATATDCTLRDATAGTIRGDIHVPAGDTRGFMLPVDSAWPQSALNNNWTLQSSASVTSLKVTALFVKNL